MCQNVIRWKFHLLICNGSKYHGTFYFGPQLLLLFHAIKKMGFAAYKTTIFFRLVENKQKRVCLEGTCECGRVKNHKFLGSTKRLVHLSYSTQQISQC